jgi:hypothetical protein
MGAALADTPVVLRYGIRNLPLRESLCQALLANRQKDRQK